MLPTPHYLLSRRPVAKAQLTRSYMEPNATQTRRNQGLVAQYHGYAPRMMILRANTQEVEPQTAQVIR